MVHTWRSLFFYMPSVSFRRFDRNERERSHIEKPHIGQLEFGNHRQRHEAQSHDRVDIVAYHQLMVGRFVHLGKLLIHPFTALVAHQAGDRHRHGLDDLPVPCQQHAPTLTD